MGKNRCIPHKKKKKKWYYRGWISQPNTYLEMFRYFPDTLCIRTKACFLLGSEHRPVISNDAEQDRSTMLPVKAKAV